MVMISDPIGDMFTRIRNGYMAGKKTVVVPYSQNKESIIKVLTDKQVIDGYKIEVQGSKKIMILKLRSHRARPLSIKRISKPGCRIYMTGKKLYPFKGNQGFLIVSTSKGVVDSVKAKQLKVGGEILAEIF